MSAEPDPVALVAWALRLTEREARLMRMAHAREFARAADAGRVAWEREGKPDLAGDPRTWA